MSLWLNSWWKGGESDLRCWVQLSQCRVVPPLKFVVFLFRLGKYPKIIWANREKCIKVYLNYMKWDMSVTAALRDGTWQRGCFSFFKIFISAIKWTWRRLLLSISGMCTENYSTFLSAVFYLIPSHLKPLSLDCESVADLWQCSFIWQSVHWISCTFICIRFLFLLFNGDCETVTIKQAQVLPFWQ